MNKLEQALRLVHDNSTRHDWPDDIWSAIEEALAEQAEQEPVCIGCDGKTDEPIMGCAAPVRTKDLTPEEIKLPVDVVIGCGTVKAGCSLQTLLTRIKVINETWIPKMQEVLQHKRGCAFTHIYQDPKECTCGVTEVSAMLKTAAPVRTKDLSDDEIADALYGKGCWRLGVHPDHLREYRRVIAADREKNK